LAPAALVALAAARGLSVLSLTDHDTINGLDEAELAAKNCGLGFIRGIELEISMPEAVTGEFHLLGLNLGRDCPAFTQAVAALAKGREDRNRQILDRMEELGVSASYDELAALSGGHSIGRPHFASLLVKRRIVKNIEQAFKKYLGRGRPFYAPKTGLDFDRAVSSIHESDGLEAWHPAAKVRSCKRLEELGASLGLFVTAGSDFHGEARPDRKLGITAGDKKIEDKLLETLPPELLKNT
jgi:predicted metal-dependent phosphoesterase TrpH